MRFGRGATGVRLPAVTILPSKISSRRQAKKQRAALRKLISTGIYTGKADLRRKPTKYQKRVISKFADVVAGRAAVLKPKAPSAYRKLFKTVDKLVIVPRRKGERIRVDKKSGEILRTRTVRGRKVQSRLRRVKAGETIKRPAPAQAVQYAIPFNRGDHIEWMRHPTFDALKAFMSEYARYKGWKKYARNEKEVDQYNRKNESELDFEDDDDLTFILEEKLGPQYGAGKGRYKKPKRRRVSRRSKRRRK